MPILQPCPRALRRSRSGSTAKIPCIVAYRFGRDIGVQDGNADFALAVAIAKARVGEAVGKVAEVCHQVHGAIGFTIEHILHRYSLRALAWRDDFGSESYWAVELGKMVAARGADELWPLVASR